MNEEGLKKFGLIKFDPSKVGIYEVYLLSVYPTPEKVNETIILKDGKVVCQWLNGTVSYANRHYLAMKEPGCV